MQVVRNLSSKAMAMNTKCGICLFRNDLRIHDNEVRLRFSTSKCSVFLEYFVSSRLKNDFAICDVFFLFFFCALRPPSIFYTLN